jgi:hypothetical protein
VQLAGGLGNQLFQYGAALLIRQHMKQVFLGPVRNEHSAREYRKLMFHRLPHVDAIPKIRTHVLDAYADWDPESFDGCTYDIHLMGCFQHLPSFTPVLRAVCQDLIEFLAPYREQMRAKYGLNDLSSVGFIHVRRGDYVTICDGNLHFVQTPEYYKEALSHIPGKRWIVLSNDTAWCGEQSIFSECTIAEEPDELCGLALMSLCQGAAIIGNSTYSWWGAMMGAEAAGSPVVYPSRWTAGQNPDLCPSRWIRI